jgi:hypothetical protein
VRDGNRDKVERESGRIGREEEAAKRKENRSRFFFSFYTRAEGTHFTKIIPKIRLDPHGLEEVKPVSTKKKKTQKFGSLGWIEVSWVSFCPPLILPLQICYNSNSKLITKF